MQRLWRKISTIQSECKENSYTVAKNYVDLSLTQYDKAFLPLFNGQLIVLSYHAKEFRLRRISQSNQIIAESKPISCYATGDEFVLYELIDNNFFVHLKEDQIKFFDSTTLECFHTTTETFKKIRYTKDSPIIVGEVEDFAIGGYRSPLKSLLNPQFLFVDTTNHQTARFSNSHEKIYFKFKNEAYETTKVFIKCKDWTYLLGSLALLQKGKIDLIGQVNNKNQFALLKSIKVPDSFNQYIDLSDSIWLAITNKTSTLFIDPMTHHYFHINKQFSSAQQIDSETLLCRTNHDFYLLNLVTREITLAQLPFSSDIKNIKLSDSALAEIYYMNVREGEKNIRKAQLVASREKIKSYQNEITAFTPLPECLSRIVSDYMGLSVFVGPRFAVPCEGDAQEAKSTAASPNDVDFVVKLKR